MSVPVPTTKTFVGTVADTVIAAAEANQAEIVAAISAAEGGVAALVENALANVKIANVFEQAAFNVLKPAIVSAITAAEASAPGSVIWAWVDAYAHKLAAEIGG